ncbi:MAG: hypothetical protein EOP54_13095 [Sphingobacteriales bacterium]|nr:MAG: hypothetical protein EOP54_13095 [Sphingobacteriales bacterium]
MRYLFLSLFVLFTGSLPCLAQKAKPYSGTKEPAGITDVPPTFAPLKPSLDTGVVRVAEKQAVSGFNISSFVAANFSYPPAVLEDSNFVSVRITVEFIVEKDASISNVQIKRLHTGGTVLQPNTERLLKKEVLRVMSKMPKWQSPAYQKGEPIRSYFNLPLNLKIE